ncbi:poly-gamma-glutamate synthase PgsB [Priestia filamentosa]|jgi:gamma-polyglutamate synthase|uniref:Poly-gamma-glutamate synthase PgsB n=2 Tax=Priestia endophytica TaxID=135735 RepID=A0A329ER88_9BACI|nr:MULTISPECIES: poly-gamma-glutamate synthase PgsB [Priestia]KAB2492612.1 poly-gamma-glutamate synthase PgsB [Priestia endophytica]KYG25657.1 poly-gamma-glutamate synthase PgsB [Priestia endophytica]MBG9811272.1 capsule biosynthesis protein CapB [Priestia endophytica]MED3726227.1 poly-gamma-glutamate synthase PgsB [Priestia filamentosa]MED4074324.1 poly-gamma-glutamate synthase PgsB [Priestia endophytica]
MALIIICAVLLLCLGMWDYKQHLKRIHAVPIRVNINGIRGKSTVTRLVTGVVKEAGYRTIGKTTGTSARMIYWHTSEEEPIKRRLEGPNIGEQRRVMKKIEDLEPDALICECMAVQPDYQITFQNQLLQANVGVIVNVLEDHMDVMGPTLDEVAQAFLAAIPYNGHLVTIESPYLDYFKEEAKKRNSEVIVADNSKITEEYLRKFDYMVFPDNASIALAVAEALGIDEETAMAGMLNAQPDPGAMRIVRFGEDEENPAFFVNGFAANDASSTLKIWERVSELGYSTNHPIVIMNCRDDRVDRTIQFAEDVLPYIPSEIVIAIGGTTSPISDAYERGDLDTNQYFDLEGYSTEEIMEELKPYLKGRVVYGVGNIHGSGEPLIEAINNMQSVRKAG